MIFTHLAYIWQNQTKLYELTVCRHLKSPLSLTGRSLHQQIPYLTLKIQDQGHGHWSHLWPRVQLMCLFFVSWQFAHFGWGIAKSTLTLKIQGETWWSHLRSRAQSICLLFVPWQMDHFWLRYNPYLTLKIQGHGHGQGQTQSSHLRPTVHMRYSKFHIWPWKFKVKVKTKI